MPEDRKNMKKKDQQPKKDTDNIPPEPVQQQATTGQVILQLNNVVTQQGALINSNKISIEALLQELGGIKAVNAGLRNEIAAMKTAIDNLHKD